MALTVMSLIIAPSQAADKKAVGTVGSDSAGYSSNTGPSSGATFPSVW